MTAKGVAKLKAALPNCNIHADVKVPASEPAATPKVIPSPPPSAALEALRRDQIPPEALTLAGDGDPKRAQASVVAVLGEAQPIHSSEVWGLAYSPDGRWLASASFDRTILLRDTATGRVKRVLQGHTAPVIAVAFSKDGRTVVSASHDGTLRLWPVAKDEKPLIVEAKLGQPAIQAMAVSPDGRFVAAGAETGLIKLWKWGEWAKPVEFPALTGKVKIRSLAFSPDGELLACGGHEEKEPAPRVRLYATADGTPKGSLPLNAKGILAVSFSHDGKHVAAAAHEGEGWGRVWEVASGKSVMELTRVIIPGEWRYAFSVAWGPDDKTLAVGRTHAGHGLRFPHRSQANALVWSGPSCSRPQLQPAWGYAGGGRVPRRHACLEHDHLEAQIPGAADTPVTCVPSPSAPTGGNYSRSVTKWPCCDGTSPVQGRRLFASWISAAIHILTSMPFLTAPTARAMSRRVFT